MLEVEAYAVSLGPPVLLSVSAAWSDFEVLQTWPKGLETAMWSVHFLSSMSCPIPQVLEVSEVVLSATI